jgi:SprT protein
MPFVPDNPHYKSLDVDTLLTGVPADKRQAVQEKLAYCDHRLQYTARGHSMPTIDYSLRGRTGGQAHTSADGTNDKIRLNKDLINASEETWQHILNQTLPHEFAHIAARRFYGKGITAHGVEWARVCHMLGIPPLRTHSMPTVRARQYNGRTTTKYKYQCGCCDNIIWMGKARHTRTQKKESWYVCRSCRTRLYPHNYLRLIKKVAR